MSYLEKKVNSKIKNLYDLGLQVIPIIAETKRPLIKWELWQTKRITDDDFNNYLLACNNFGFVTGELSGIVVIDADNQDAINWCNENLPPTFVLNYKTGKAHYYFKHHKKHRIINNTKILGKDKPPIDRRADGGFARFPVVPELTKEILDNLPTYEDSWFPIIDKKERTHLEVKDIVNQPIKERMARDFLNNKKGCQEGTGADKYCFALACALVGEFLLTKESAIDLLYEWGQKSDQLDTNGRYFPWSLKDITHKIETALDRVDFTGSGLKDWVNYANTDHIGQSKPEVKEKRFRFYTEKELFALPPLKFLVDDHLPEKGLCVIFGQSGNYKTFYALEMAKSISTGLSFFKKYKVNTKKPVVYIASEGFFGLQSRIKSWNSDRSVSDQDNILYLNDSLHKDEDYIHLLNESQEHFGQLPIVFIDTLSCNFSGDTSSNEQMNIWCQRLLRIFKDTLVVVIHHAGWLSDHERGASAIRDNATTSIQINKPDAHSFHAVKCVKQKDFAPFDSYCIEPNTIEESVVLRIEDRSIVKQKVLQDLAKAIGDTNKSLNIKQIMSLTWVTSQQLNDRTIRRYLKEAVALNLLEQLGKGVMNDEFQWFKC